MWPFKLNKSKEIKPPPPPELYEVGKAIVTITKIKTELEECPQTWDLTLEGKATDILGSVFIKTAFEAFQSWRDDGKSGTLWVGNGVYIPLNIIGNISVEYKKLKKETSYIK